MKSLRKNKVAILFTITFLFSAITLGTRIGAGALDNIEEGDSIYYKVSKYSVPLETIFPEASSINTSDVTLDLTDSTVGLKVMKKNQDGSFLLNTFLILGKSIVIPFPETTSDDLRSIFGDNLVIPAGVGISLGTTIPGSNYVNRLDTDPTNDDSGIPVYIEPDKTSDYKSYFEKLFQPGFGFNVSVTDDIDTFQVTITQSSSFSNSTFVVTWFKTGANAGLFKAIDIDISSFESPSETVDPFSSLNSPSKTVNVAIGFSFDKKENQPLPDEIKNLETQTYAIERADFNLSFTGIFAENVPQSTLDSIEQIKNNFTSNVGKDIVRISVTEVKGMYYKANIEFKNFDTNSWTPILNDVWFNGFTGAPTYSDPTQPNPYSTNNFNSQGFTLIPFYAPGITSDWTIWQANVNTITTIYNLITTAVTSANAKTTLLKYGLSLDKFSSKTELRNSGQFNFFYGENDLSLSYKASDAENDLPPTFDGTESANLDMNSNAWMSYTDKGLFAGVALALTADLSVTNFPFQNSSNRVDGSIKLNFDFKIKNNKFESLPEGKDAGLLFGGGLFPTPGFELLPLLITLVISGVYINRKRRGSF